MSEAKSTILKSKSRSDKILSKSSSGATNVTNNVSEKSTSSISSALSLLDKLDMNNLKKTTYKYVSNFRSATSDKNGKEASSKESENARNACIEYALELVISNLIVNGQLDPTKAHQMRTPIMKGHIASMCDRILEKRTASPLKQNTEVKKPSSKSMPSTLSQSKKGSVQKWAAAAAAVIPKVTEKVVGTKKLEAVGKKALLHFKPAEINLLSVEDGKKLKNKKSKGSSVTIVDPAVLAQKSSKQIPPQLTAGIGASKKASKTQEQTSKQRLHQATSEVPSNFSIEGNSRLLSSNSGRSVQFEMNEQKSKDKIAKETPVGKTPSGNTGASAPATTPPQAVTEGSNASLNKPPSNPKVQAKPKPTRSQEKSLPAAVTTPVSNEPETLNRNRSCPGTAKTLTSIISSTSSISSNTKGYRTVVDMNGFQNDEIEMEARVELRQLVFKASRPKKDDLNLRKVTEIIEIPENVKMEHLKIGRRNGYVVIEEGEQAETENH